MSIDNLLKEEGFNTNFSDSYVLKEMVFGFVKGMSKPYLALMDKTNSALNRIYDFIFQ